MPRRPSQGGEGFCPSCNEKRTFHLEDCGIGSYEFWGARGTHHDWRPICDECGDEINADSVTLDDREPEWEPDFEDPREDR